MNDLLDRLETSTVHVWAPRVEMDPSATEHNNILRKLDLKLALCTTVM